MTYQALPMPSAAAMAIAMKMSTMKRNGGGLESGREPIAAADAALLRRRRDRRVDAGHRLQRPRAAEEFLQGKEPSGGLRRQDDRARRRLRRRELRVGRGDGGLAARLRCLLGLDERDRLRLRDALFG